RLPPRPTPFPTRRSSDLLPETHHDGDDSRSLDQVRLDARDPTRIEIHLGLPKQCRSERRLVSLPELTEARIGEGRLAIELVETRSEEHTSELQSRENLVC